MSLNIMELVVCKSKDMHILTAIVTNDRVFYLKNFVELNGSEFTPKLEPCLINYMLDNYSYHIPSFTFNNIPLLFSDIPTRRYEVSNLDIFNYLRTLDSISTVDRKIIKSFDYNILKTCKANLIDYTGCSNEELVSIPLPEKCMDTSYSSQTRLKINIDNIQSFNPSISASLYQNSINKSCIYFNKDETDTKYNSNKMRMTFIDDRLRKYFNISSINWSGRKYTEDHYGILLINASNGAIPMYKHYNKNTGNVSMRTDDLEYYLDTLPNIEEYKILKSILRGMLEYKNLSWENSTIYNSIIKYNYVIAPEVSESDTYRMQLKNPSPQIFTPNIRELITAPKGYKMARVDISGQDLHILFERVLENQRLKDLYREKKDPYMAVLSYLGYAETPENKKVAKVPILGIVNGMGQRTAHSRVEPKYAPMISQIYDLITRDPGYLKVKLDSEILASMQPPIKKGFVGLANTVSSKEKQRSFNIFNSVLNANFQLTSSEIFRLSIWAFINHIHNNKIRTSTRVLSPDDLSVILCIHDEVIFIYKDDLLDSEVEDIISYYILPQINNWSPMNGKITVGLTHYVKE